MSEPTQKRMDEIWEQYRQANAIDSSNYEARDAFIAGLSVASMSEVTKERMDEIRGKVMSMDAGAPKDSLAGLLVDAVAAHDHLAARCREAEAREKRLRQFALDILEDFPESAPDEFEIQDLAVKHGILVAHEVSEPCCESCWCAEYHDEFPVTCYRRAEWLTAATAQEAER